MTEPRPARLPLSRILGDLFQAGERLRLLTALGVSVVAAIFETAGVASILPFMALALDPAALARFTLLAKLAIGLGITSRNGALLLFGAITVTIVALGNLAAALNLIVQQRFAARTQARLASTLLDGYMARPYAFHVERDTPSLMKVLTVDVGSIMTGVVSPFMTGFSRLLTTIGILALLFIRDPIASVLVTIAFGLAYLLIYRWARIRQFSLGASYKDLLLARQRTGQEALAGVKELQVMGREQYAVSKFESVASAAAHAQATNNTVAQLPRYVMETVAFGGILLITVAVIARGGSQSPQLIPLLALYAFAGYRLLPALQQIFGAALDIRFRLSSLYLLHDDFVQGEAAVQNRNRTRKADSTVMKFGDSLRFEEVSFTYPGARRPALRDVSLAISPHERIGLVGSTGAGKTTLAEAALGIHSPSQGRITVDGIALDPNTIESWRRRVGYVPQHVFLANASVAENIALGLNPGDIDHAAVQRAAESAQAAKFIHDLPEGFNTVIGEHGVKLSGGQRQRLGIARALYHEPDVIVFDEATSALDGLTEEGVMQAIHDLGGRLTIILIAHRLRTVEACDRIVMMSEGRIVAEGTYSELMASSPDFQQFTKARAATQDPVIG